MGHIHSKKVSILQQGTETGKTKKSVHRMSLTGP